MVKHISKSSSDRNHRLIKSAAAEIEVLSLKISYQVSRFEQRLIPLSELIAELKELAESARTVPR